MEVTTVSPRQEFQIFRPRTRTPPESPSQGVGNWNKSDSLAWWSIRRDEKLRRDNWIRIDAAFLGRFAFLKSKTSKPPNMAILEISVDTLRLDDDGEGRGTL